MSGCLFLDRCLRGHLALCHELNFGIYTARLQKAGEEARVGGFLQVDFFRVELRRYHKAMACDFEHFGDAIISLATNHYAPARLMHCLVMEAVDHEWAWTEQL